MKKLLLVAAFSTCVYADSDIDCGNKEIRSATFENEAVCRNMEHEQAEINFQNYYENLLKDMQLAAEKEEQNPPFGISIKTAIPQLIKSQKLWGEMVEIDCELVATNKSNAGGSIQADAFSGCKNIEIEKRLKYLEEIRAGWL